MIRPRSNDLPLLAGWLFADLLLAFAVIMLGSSSGDPEAAAAATSTTTTTTSTTIPAVPPPTALPGIAPDPIVFQPNANYDVLMGPAGPAREAARENVRNQTRQFFAAAAQSGVRAGFVLSFGIHPETGAGQQLASEYNRLLQEAAPDVFGSARMRTFDLRSSQRRGGANIEVYYLT